jgi:hypothetical protein
LAISFNPEGVVRAQPFQGWNLLSIIPGLGWSKTSTPTLGFEPLPRWGRNLKTINALFPQCQLWDTVLAQPEDAYFSRLLMGNGIIKEQNMFPVRAHWLFACCSTILAAVNLGFFRELWEFSQEHEFASHIFLIPFISALLIIRERKRIFAHARFAP